MLTFSQGNILYLTQRLVCQKHVVDVWNFLYAKLIKWVMIMQLQKL